MILTKNEVISQVSKDLKKRMEEKTFGEIGITITMHEGYPVKISENLTTNIIRRSNGFLEITK
jgi:hypothetical protein